MTFNPTDPLSDEEEKELIELAQKGNEKAFNRLIAHYRPYLFEYACQRLGYADSADEAVQNATIYAWTHLSCFTYRPHRFKFWLLVVTKNHIKRVREDRVFVPDIWGDLPDSSTPDPLGEVIDAENRAEGALLVESYLACLPKMQREVLRLSLDGANGEDIAERLNIDPNSVYVNLHRARKRLRKQCKIHLKSMDIGRATEIHTATRN